MRFWPVLLLLALPVAGCGNRREANLEQVATSVREVEPAERGVRRDFKARMRALLAERQYARLTQVADSLRATRARFADDRYALVGFIDAFGLDETPPEQDAAAWSAAIAQLEGWRAAMPDSPLPDVALAETFVNLAWKARGTGFAFTVSDTGWAGYEQALNRARDVLDTAATKRPLGLEYYLARGALEVGLGLPSEESEKTFRGAIARDSTCEDAYWRRADYLLPRWYGDPGEWEAWLEHAVAPLSPDDGDRVYAAVCTEMSYFHQQLFEECKLSWPRMRRGLRLRLERRPQSLQIVEECAFNASLASDAAMAQEMFRRTGSRCYLRVWRDKRNFAQCWAWAHAQPQVAQPRKAHEAPAQ